MDILPYAGVKAIRLNQHQEKLNTSQNLNIY